MGVAVVVAIVLVGAAIAYAVYLYNKKHRDLLAAWAAANGWTYTARDDSWVDRWAGEPFGCGHSRKAQNVLTGTFRDHGAVALDYEYRETHYNGNSTSETTYKYSVYALALPCRLPRVSVEPEGFFSKVARAVGVHDIELESDDFNRAFRVSADDRKLAYDLLPARTMELLMRQPDVHVRTEGDTLLCFDRNWLDPELIEARLALLAAFLDNVPAFVWHDRGVPRTAPTATDTPT